MHVSHATEWRATDLSVYPKTLDSRFLELVQLLQISQLSALRLISDDKRNSQVCVWTVCSGVFQGTLLSLPPNRSLLQKQLGACVIHLGAI